MAQKLEILIQLCDALGHAHSHGVIHRDVKPGNVFLTRERTVKVVDFGLALHKDSLGKSQMGGTIPYMSPEQLGSGNPDSRSDVWSTGVTAYELLTGKLPFHGPELLRQILASPVPLLDSSMPLAGDLNRVLGRALAKNKDEPYPTAGLLATDLHRLQRASEISSYSTRDAVEKIPVDTDPLPDTKPLEHNWPQQHQAEYLRALDFGFRCSATGQVAIRTSTFT
jgi:serine/threonine protein kinase